MNASKLPIIEGFDCVKESRLAKQEVARELAAVPAGKRGEHLRKSVKALYAARPSHKRELVPA